MAYLLSIIEQMRASQITPSSFIQHSTIIFRQERSTEDISYPTIFLLISFVRIIPQQPTRNGPRLQGKKSKK